jgi:hypothetical protein
MAEKIDPARLVTVGTYALTFKDGAPVNRSYIYKLIREGKLQTIEIDKIKFIVLPEPSPEGPA